MSNIYKGEMQDYEGNTIYPHTASDVVFCPDGETVQQKLSKAETTLDNITGVSDSTELDDGTKLATSKAVNALRENVNSSLGGLKFGVDDKGNYGYIKDGADTVYPFSGGDISLNFVQGTAQSSAVSVTFNPARNTSYIVMGGRRYGGVFTAYIKNSSGSNIASVLITASADYGGANYANEVDVKRVACKLEKDKTYTLYIPSQGSGYANFAFAIYP